MKDLVNVPKGGCMRLNGELCVHYGNSEIHNISTDWNPCDESPFSGPLFTFVYASDLCVCRRAGIVCVHECACMSTSLNAWMNVCAWMYMRVCARACLPGVGMSELRTAGSWPRPGLAQCIPTHRSQDKKSSFPSVCTHTHPHVHTRSKIHNVWLV